MRWFFLISGLIACTGKPVSASCPVELNPPIIVVKYGDPLSANCRTLSNQTEGLGWESIYGGTGLIPGVTSLPLKIDAVNSWDLQPQCYINLADGNQCIKYLPCIVYKMPASVSMSVSQPVTSPMVEGQKYHLQCNVQDVAPAGKLSVHWHRGNEIIYRQTFVDSSSSPVNKMSEFNLTASREDNGTQIWCEAKLDLRPAYENPPTMQSNVREVTVLYPPAFTKPANETLELVSGEKITLNCAATGNPMPVYNWSFPDPMRKANKNQDVNQPSVTPPFQLPGTYSCTASNTQGTSTKYFTVVEPTRNQTTLAAIVGVFVTLGVLLFIGGLVFVTKDGTFSFNKGNYLRGQPTSAGIV